MKVIHLGETVTDWYFIEHQSKDERF